MWNNPNTALGDPMAFMRGRYPGLFPGQSTPLPPSGASSGGSMFAPAPMEGNGPWGKVPGTINVPGSIEKNINSDLMGLVTPEVAQRLQNEAARLGVSSGMPGSGLQWNSYLHDYLGASDAAKQRGLKNWQSMAPIAEHNAELLAAPNPQQRGELEQSFAQQMFNQYLGGLRGAGGRGGASFSQGPAGGTGAYALPQGPAASNSDKSSPYPNSQDVVSDYIGSYMDDPNSWMWPDQPWPNVVTPD